MSTQPTAHPFSPVRLDLHADQLHLVRRTDGSWMVAVLRRGWFFRRRWVNVVTHAEYGCPIVFNSYYAARSVKYLILGHPVDVKFNLIGQVPTSVQ